MLIAGIVGAGALRDICALEGTAECARPLRAEVSGEACVYYAVSVERQYEEAKSEGGQTTSSRGSETMASNMQRVEFELRDATGVVSVLPADAQIEACNVVERFEPRSPRPDSSSHSATSA